MPERKVVWAREEIARGSPDRTRHLEYYLRPPLLGAAALCLLVVEFMLVLVLDPEQTFELWGDAFLALVVAAGVGIVGGLTYVFLGRPMRGVPRLGPYLAGIVTPAGYLGAAAIASSLFQWSAPFWIRSRVVVLAVVSLLVGCVIGHAAFRRVNPAQAARELRTTARLRSIALALVAIPALTVFIRKFLPSEAAIFAIIFLLGGVLEIGPDIWRDVRGPDGETDDDTQVTDRTSPQI